VQGCRRGRGASKDLLAAEAMLGKILGECAPRGGAERCCLREWWKRGGSGKARGLGVSALTDQDRRQTQPGMP
jgi:hypothetical protein